jgi:hypothetical protein
MCRARLWASLLAASLPAKPASRPSPIASHLGPRCPVVYDHTLPRLSSSRPLFLFLFRSSLYCSQRLSKAAAGLFRTIVATARNHRSNGDVIEKGHGRTQASPGTPMNTPLSVNVSELRLGLVSRESHTELALFSQYSEDELSQAAPDEHTTASSSATPVRRRTLVIRFVLVELYLW